MRDDEMRGIAERIWKFQAETKSSFEDGVKILFLVKLEQLDRSIHNGFVGLCNSGRNY